MGAHLTNREGDWYVRLTLLGEDIDEAGPFDDRADAEMAAERALRLAGVL